TLLVFSDFSDPDAMALNSRLKKLYESGKVKIYQVGVDADRLTWRNAASNLPWTTVFATVSEVNDICAKYMVTSLPTVFVIDARGDISARPGNLDEINSLL
ncbi:MAG: thioredoxin family protein, partial [Muribaculaceae bacterium]|nr:thioredoxin family protein [Muribaculaceae bacterium]